MVTITHFSPLSDNDILHAIKHAELPEPVVSSNLEVVAILTQSWCWQWIEMNKWLKELVDTSDSHNSPGVYYYEYDKSDLFDKFRVFKERRWENHEVPYLRYYRRGRLIASSNYVTQSQFFFYFAS